MTPNEWLHEVVAAANRVVSRMWIGHEHLPAAGADGTARDVLDRMFHSVATSTTSFGGDAEVAGHPFTGGWVPMSEFSEATDRLLGAADRFAADSNRSVDDARAEVCAAATALLLLTIDLADTIGVTYGPFQAPRDAVAALPR